MKVRKCFSCGGILPNDNCMWIYCKESASAKNCDFLYYFNLKGNITSIAIEIKERHIKDTSDYVVYRYKETDFALKEKINESFIFNIEKNELIDRIIYKFKLSKSEYNQNILQYSFTNNEDIVNKLKNYKKELLKIYKLLIFN